jgi:hypothetical protein
MRGCNRYLALALAILFVFTTVPILFIFNLGQVTTNREAVKEALTGQALLDEAFAILVREGVRSQPAIQSLPTVIRDSEAVQQALENLIPADWVISQTNEIVDAVFNYLETDDPSTLVVHVDIGPLFASLQGEPGRQMVLAVLQSLPPCTLDNLPSIDLSAGRVDIQGCMPPLVPTELVANQLHSLAAQVINENTATAIIGDSVEFSLLGPDLQTQARTLNSLQQLRTAYLFARYGVWFLWLIPLGLLILILLLVVRSIGEFGHWWGWPLLATGTLSIFMLVVLPPVLDIGLGGVSQAISDSGVALVVSRLVRLTLEALLDAWRTRVFIQAVLILIAGVILVGVGFVGILLLPKSKAAQVD